MKKELYHADWLRMRVEEVITETGVVDRSYDALGRSPITYLPSPYTTAVDEHHRILESDL